LNDATGSLISTSFQPFFNFILVGSRYSYPSSINGISELPFCPPCFQPGGLIIFPLTQIALPLSSHAAMGGESVAGERERLLNPIQKLFSFSSLLQILVTAYQVVLSFGLSIAPLHSEYYELSESLK
jgi:hypothetical protein